MPYRSLTDRSFLDSPSPSALELEQLVAALKEYSAGLDETALFSKTMKEFDGLAETAIEWWDLVDENKTPVYQIWLYGVDSGCLFRHGTTDKVGRMCQFGWDGDDEELALALQTAQREVQKAKTRCLLKEFDFEP
jgi:hypothetical protein